MIYLVNPNTDPALNHAIEEYYMKETDLDVFSIWQNRPTVLLGKNQDAYQELNLDYTKENDIRVVRRLSGGGTVYCDLGNMQYSLITKDDGESGPESFQLFARPVVAALKALGLEAEFTGRNDILIDGKKISGNAQYRNKGRIIHHGTLLFKADLEALKGAINSRPIKFKNKGVKSVISRVTTISEYLKDMKVEDFIKYLQDYVIDYYKIEKVVELDQDLIKKAEKYLDRFNDIQWNLGKNYNDYVSKSKKYPFGLVEYKAIIKDGKIDYLNILGDYFEGKDKDDLLVRLNGVDQDEKSIRLALEGINVSDFITGMDKDTLIDDLLSLKRGE